MHEKSLIRLVNKDLKNTCDLNSIAQYKISQFSNNMISNLLRVTSVQNTTNIIGHQDIRSTMSYERYACSKSEIQDLLKQIIEKDLKVEINNTLILALILFLLSLIF